MKLLDFFSYPLWLYIMLWLTADARVLSSVWGDKIPKDLFYILM